MAVVKKKAKADAPKAIPWPFGKTNYILFGLALLVIVIGYVLLGSGSITMAPILLVLGYCVLIPLAIVYRGKREPSEATETPAEQT